MARLKVAHIITLLEWGGAQGNTLFTVKHLDRKEFDVILISGQGAILDKEVGKIPDLRVFFLKNMVHPINPLRDLLCLFQLISLLRKEKPDIVHTHSSKAGILGRLACLFSGVPVVIHTIHGFGFNPYQKFFVRWLFVTLEKITARISNCLVAVSKENIETGLRLGIGRRDQYHLIRSGVRIEKIRSRAGSSDPGTMRRNLGIPNGRKIVLSVGPFKLQKDPLAMVRCARKVSDLYPEVQFLFVGDGEMRGRIEEEIRRLRLETRFMLPGWRKEIPEILNMSDVFVLTSLWEGLPRSAVEALIVGKPVVAYAVDGVPEVVRDGENGYLVQPGSLDDFSEKVVRILKDGPLYERLAANARKTIDPSFDIVQMVRQQEDLYHKLTSSPV